jgi:peptidoglycan/LPS O-acetylase OafA/YrhL
MAIYPFTSATKVAGRETITFISSTTLIVVFAFLVAIFISQVVRHQPTSKIAVKINDCGTKLAAFSYSLYITHWQFTRIMHLLGFNKMHYVNATNILIYSLLIIASLVFAYLFYLIFERNTNRIKSHIKRWLNV